MQAEADKMPAFAVQYAGFVQTTTASKRQLPDVSHAEGAHIMMSLLPPHALPLTAQHAKELDLLVSLHAIQLLLPAKKQAETYLHAGEEHCKNTRTSTILEKEIAMNSVVLVTAFETSVYVIAQGDAARVFDCHRFVLPSQEKAQMIQHACQKTHLQCIELSKRRRSSSSNKFRSRWSSISSIFHAQRLRGRGSSNPSPASSISELALDSGITSPVGSPRLSASHSRAAMGSIHSLMSSRQASLDSLESPVSVSPPQVPRMEEREEDPDYDEDDADELEDVDTSLFEPGDIRAPADTRDPPMFEDQQEGIRVGMEECQQHQMEDVACFSSSPELLPGSGVDYGCHGDISFVEVQLALQCRSRGAWLLRSTADPSIPYVLSIVSAQGRLKHVNVFLMDGLYKLSGVADMFDDLAMLLAHCIGMEIPIHGQLLGEQILPCMPSTRVACALPEAQTMA
eukprot:m.80159 g.80159  ORF g.80159 m.80159 type:complete len:455 (-) comp14194_c1_seq1:112-1476(-)